MSTAIKRSVADIVTDNIITQLEAGTPPWRKPWKVIPGAGAPGNVVSKRPYRGVNALITATAPFDEPWWITRKQAAQRELRISDEHYKNSTEVVLWKPLERKCAPDALGAVFSNGQWVTRSMLMRFYNVWNIEQLDQYADDNRLGGLVPEQPADDDGVWDTPVLAASAMLDAYHAREDIALKTDPARAYYAPLLDQIGMPPISTFDSPEVYHSTRAHEAVHSTGHARRLNREGIVGIDTTFGSEKYALEELIAEIGASMVCALTGIEPDYPQSAAYCGNWLRALNDDRSLVIKAAQAAQKALDLIAGVAPDA